MNRSGCLLIVEDQPYVRETLALVCRTIFKFRDIFAVATAAEATEWMFSKAAELMIVDIYLPDGDGITLSNAATLKPSAPAILVISGQLDEVTVFRIMKSKIRGLIEKSDLSMATLQMGIDESLAGHRYFSATAKEMESVLLHDPLAFPKILTPRECRILAGIARGAEADDLSRALGVSTDTVRWHFKQIMGKLGIHNAVGLAAYALKKGFVHWEFPEA